MKKFTKVCLIVAGSLLGLGLILTIVGGVLGGFSLLNHMVIDEDIPFVGRNHGYHFQYNYRDNGNHHFSIDEDFDNTADFLDTGDFSDTAELSYTDIDQLRLDVGAGKVYVTQGSSDAVKIRCNKDNVLTCNVEGSKLSVKRIKELVSQEVEVYIELPENQIFEKVDIEMAAGVLSIDKLLGKEVDLDMDAGVMTINALEADTVDAQLNAGEMDITVTASQIDAECNMGAMTLKSGLPQDSYNYKIDCALGKIAVGSDSYEGMSSEKHIDNGKENTMELECNAGEIDVLFNL